MMIDSDVRRVFHGTSIAHFAVVLPDGSPHTVPLRVGTDEGRIVFLTAQARNLRRVLARSDDSHTP